MKRLFAVGFLCGMLIFLLAACNRKTADDGNDLVCGQITDINEVAVTIERGNYKNTGTFEAIGKESTYNLPEMVYYDDFNVGDIVAILLDGKDATMVTDAEDIMGTAVKVSQEDADKRAAADENMLLTAAHAADGTKNIFKADAYAASGEDQSVILAKNGSVLTIEGSIISKRGDSTNLEASSLHGLNSAFAVISGAHVDADDVTVNSNAEGADGVFVSGSKSGVNLDGCIFNVYGDSARGLAAAYGGVIEADETNIVASGEESPGVYSAGNVSLLDSTVASEKNAAAVIEGRNSIALKNCKLTGSGDGGVIFYGQGSGEDSSVTAKLAARYSQIQYQSDGAMFHIAGSSAIAALTDTSLQFGSGILAQVTAEGYNGADSNAGGGKFILKGMDQKFTGEIKCDQSSRVKLLLTEKSKFTGAIDTENTAAYSKIYLSRDSDWSVTADSYVRSISNEKKTCANIKSNGHNIYYDADNLANEWLGSRTVELPGGGLLMPTE